MRNHLGSYFVDLNILGPFQNMLLPSNFSPLKSWHHIWEREKCELVLETNLCKCSNEKMHLDDWLSKVPFELLTCSKGVPGSVSSVTHKSGPPGLRRLTTRRCILRFCHFPPECSVDSRSKSICYFVYLFLGFMECSVRTDMFLKNYKIFLAQ